MTGEQEEQITGAEKEEQLARKVREGFGQRLGLARASIYPDQDSAGAAFGLKKGRWGGWERGRTEPPLWVLRQLPAKLHRPLSWFFNLPDERDLNEAEGRIVCLLRALPPENRATMERSLIGILEAQFPRNP